MPIAPTPPAVAYTPEQAAQRANNAAIKRLTALQWNLFGCLVTSRKAAADVVYAGNLEQRQSLNAALGEYAPTLGLTDVLLRVPLAVSILEPASHDVADVIAELQKPFVMPTQNSDGSWSWDSAFSPAGTLVPADVEYSVPGVDLMQVVGGIVAAISPLLNAETVVLDEATAA